MDAKFPDEFIGFGATDAQFAYEITVVGYAFTWFAAVDFNFPMNSHGSGPRMHTPPCELTWFGAKLAQTRPK